MVNYDGDQNTKKMHDIAYARTHIHSKMVHSNQRKNDNRTYGTGYVRMKKKQEQCKQLVKMNSLG